MYESFFGFSEKPFNITPDPKYLYLSDQHQEAIAHLRYGIDERGGFVVITGEVGTGKTTLCRHLLNNMDDRTEGAIIFNPNLSEIELLRAINDDFGLNSSAQTKKELIDDLNSFVLEERLRGRNMVLIIDEAQNLLPAVLEQVRMLSNIETEKEKLIQIILIGQPQLQKILARPEFVQLNQRITARYHLNALNLRETYRYIQHRLDIASGPDIVKFDSGAMKTVYRYSKGIPRLINVVCDRALLGAFTAGRRSPIPKKIVKQAINEVAGPRLSWFERLSLERTAVRLFVFPFAITLAATVSWLALTMLGALRSPGDFVAGKEMIPDSPAQRVVASFAAAPPAPTQENAAFAASAPAPPAPVQASALEEETPAPYSEEEKKRLTDILLSESYEESRISASRNLIGLWGKNPQFKIDKFESFHELAQSQEMRCTAVWANFAGLRSTNMPCILEMFVPLEVRPRYAVLTKIGEDKAKILYDNDGPVELPLQLLDEFWLRRAFIFWEDFESLGELLKPGDYGGSVVWLQASLQTLGLYSGDLNGAFDEATETAVRQFQQENNLLLDGVVGPKTRLVLYAHLKRYLMPRLDDGEGT